jgi:acetyl-CoA/propionyl-CoA carboxylase, biotin carboxylase, biotin carboxyl carrier protein
MGPMTLRLRSGPARVVVEHEGRRHVATVARDGRRAWVHIGGHVFIVEPRRAESRRGSAAADHDALSPPMPATVARVHVKAGDAVINGDVIVLLEAMKMELPIRAPRDGVIARVNCRAGEMVQPGTPLVDLE